MRQGILAFIVIGFWSLPVQASFDFVIDSGYQSSFTIENFETLQMTGGGVGLLDLFNDSYAEILNTTPYQLGVGGIERLHSFDRSYFVVQVVTFMRLL